MLRAGVDRSSRSASAGQGRAVRLSEACPHDLREFAPGPVQALAFDEEGGRRVDSNSPAAFDVEEDALSKRVLAQGRVGLRWVELKSPCHRAQVVV
jgi:hypothetical protein